MPLQYEMAFSRLVFFFLETAPPPGRSIKIRARAQERWSVEILISRYHVYSIHGKQLSGKDGLLCEMPLEQSTNSCLPSNLSLSLSHFFRSGGERAPRDWMKSALCFLTYIERERERLMKKGCGIFVWKQYFFVLNGLQIGCQIVIERVKVKYMGGKWNGCRAWAFCVF